MAFEDEVWLVSGGDVIQCRVAEDQEDDGDREEDSAFHGSCRQRYITKGGGKPRPYVGKLMYVKAWSALVP